jgi:hypothetical protein
MSDMKLRKPLYCIRECCGHINTRHVCISAQKGAPCTAPLGEGKTCRCKGYVSAQPKKKEADDAV